MNIVKELEPKEKVALGASLFLFLGIILVVGLSWEYLSGNAKRQQALPPAAETNSVEEVQRALDGALESISNRLFRTARPSDLR